MTADDGARPRSLPARDGADLPDAAHLDEDPEALEDPVHSGDARHQHELHAEPRLPAD